MSHATSATTASPHEEPSYHAFLTALQTRFEARIGASPTAPLYTTQVTDETTLFNLFLAALPAAQVQYYTCHACRRFVNQYGSLVTIDSEGKTASVLWDAADVPALFARAVDALRTHVETARVSGVFLSAARVWGTPVTGEWTHMAIRPPSTLIYRDPLKTAFQMMAEKKEDYRTMGEALAQLPLRNVNVAVQILQSEALYRNEKVLGVAEWLQSLHAARERVTHRQRENVLWRAIGTAPPGYCHPRSSMIGTLLDDIEAGLAFDVIARRFAAKMHPLHYQRPQVAPGEQNIKRAEEIVAKLGIATALQRRYARLDEIIAIWTPKLAPPTAKTGVFAQVMAKTAVPVSDTMKLPITTMTVEKFKRTVLATANSIEFWVPRINANYTALTTAADASAPPILQWDHAERRNPVSSYVYHGGSAPTQWGLTGGTLCKVLAVTQYPASWHADNHLPHMGNGLIMILEGARDTAWRTAGAALFPETLKAELREVRATIEAYSKTATIGGYDDASACGVLLSAQAKAGHRFRVTTNTTTVDYELDRWD